MFFLLFLSVCMDIVWCFLVLPKWWETERYDGDVEKTIRRFNCVTTVISLFVRFFALLMYWKLSVDFNRLFRNRGDRSMFQGAKSTVFNKNNIVQLRD